VISLLSKIFIENKEYNKAEYRRAYGILCGFLGIFLNFILFVFKLIAGTLSHSMAISADAFNNLSDAGSSIVSLLGFKLAAGKADAEHPYGHGRIEYIAGLIVSFLIMIMAIELIQSSFEKILNPVSTEFNTIIFIILLVSIIIKFYMICYNKSIGTKIDSPSLKATASDSLGDVITTSVVLISAIINYFFGFRIDSYCGLIVGLFILYSGFCNAKETVSPLLGKAPHKEYIDRIKELVLESPEIIGIHDIIVHDYGPMHTMVSLHAEVNAKADLISIHNVIDTTEKRLSYELGCEAVIHIDPVVNNYEHNKINQLLKSILSKIDPSIGYHDLQILNNGLNKPVISCDIVVSATPEINDIELKEKISSMLIKSTEDKYIVELKIDQDFGTSE